MRAFFRAVRQLLPSKTGIIGYWAVSVAFLLLLTAGLKSTGAGSAALWDIPLRDFGSSSDQIIRNAHLEFLRHLWTVLVLPYGCFFGMKPIQSSFQNAFARFLHYGRRSRLFIEGARVTALIIVVFLLCLPSLAGTAWAAAKLGLSRDEAMTALASASGCLLFTLAIIYLLSACSVPPEICMGLGLVAPFFLSGLSHVLEKSLNSTLSNWLPPGVPYSIESFASPSLRAGLAYFGIIIAGRLIATARTRYLRDIPDPSSGTAVPSAPIASTANS